MKKLDHRGPYRRTDLPYLLNGIDVAVIPSIAQESFNLTLSEVNSLGIPAIVADHGALSERVEHGKDGWKFIPGSLTSLKGVISDIQEDGALLHPNWDTRKSLITLSQMVERYSELYEDLLIDKMDLMQDKLPVENPDIVLQ